MGDEIVSFRFLKYLNHKNYIWYSLNDQLAKVIRSCGYNAKSYIDCSGYDESDVFQCDAEHLPLILGLTKDQLWYGAYLNSPERLRSVGKLRVGIKTHGNKDYAGEVFRTCPESVILDSLPKDSMVFSLDKMFPTIQELINYIGSLDLIVTTCTMTAHIAGALGKPTVVLVPTMANYTWESDRTDDRSDWYGENLLLSRQNKAFEWDSSAINNKIMALIESYVPTS
jgi:hypothetical protein